MTKARDLANASTALSAVSATELGYVDGVTSAIQTQMDAKTAKSTLTTTGDIYYASAANTPARLGIGTTGQVLNVAAGLPAWATPAAGGGGLVFISRTTFSNVASQAFDSVFTSTYQKYYVALDSLYSGSGSDDLHLQFRYAGPTTEATNYYGSMITLNYNNTSTVLGSNGSAQYTMANEVGLLSSGQQGGGYLFFSNVGNSSQKPYVNTSYNSGLSGTPTIGGTQNDNQRTYTGFLLKAQTSNITGTVTVYGLANS